MNDCMPLTMIEKSALTPAQQRLVETRLDLPEHEHDMGPPKVWKDFHSGMLAYFQGTSGRLVALVEASGDDYVQPGWWIDTDFRSKGYGNQVIDMLADHLKSRGVKHIGPMAITTFQGQHDAASSRLAQRLRKHFE